MRQTGCLRDCLEPRSYRSTRRHEPRDEPCWQAWPDDLEGLSRSRNCGNTNAAAESEAYLTGLTRFDIWAGCAPIRRRKTNSWIDGRPFRRVPDRSFVLTTPVCIGWRLGPQPFFIRPVLPFELPASALAPDLPLASLRCVPTLRLAFPGLSTGWSRRLRPPQRRRRLRPCGSAPRRAPGWW